MTPVELDLFESKVEPEPMSGCWLWTGRPNSEGYGRMQIDGRRQYSHRMAYAHWVGPIPEGLEIDHLCRVRSCVNPKHMEPVSRRTNILRGEGPTALHSRQTHCRRGHQLDGFDGRRRRCSICELARDRRRRQGLT